ncbi:MAG TPA: CHRD domain-containing protein [Steroidobacteraceae bacterium]|nr:CHRD domain-containing protein [Steroidobacteraceae bacterium]
MNRQHILIAAVASAFVLVAGSATAHDKRFGHFKNYIATHLVPAQEVPLVLSQGSGQFKAVIDEVNQTITYELSYKDLESPPQQSHIHIGQKNVNGGVTFFLCGNPGNTPATVPPAAFPQPPACPASPDTITGVITPANLVGPLSQGVTPADFAKVVGALRSGDTYANVHTTRSPGGEVRGQVKIGFLNDRDWD